MNLPPLNLSPGTLNVWAIFREALLFGWTQRRVLLPWIIFGAILSGLVSVVEFYLGSLVAKNESIDGMGLKNFGIIFVASIPVNVVFVFLAVYCHRKIFLPWEGKEGDAHFKFLWREWKFLLGGLAIYFCTLIFILPFSIIGGTIVGMAADSVPGDHWVEAIWIFSFTFGMVILPIFYFFGRLSLVLPAIAVDGDPSLRWSWKQTKGNGVAMLFLVGFFPLIVGLIYQTLPVNSLGQYFGVITFLGSFTLFVLVPVEVAVISIAFRELTNWSPIVGTPSSPAEP